MEILCSLADAIVAQNLSVLTRGSTLRHKVLLLGGPNAYLPFLRDCWRLRIPETWEQRGYDYPKDMPLDELILVPKEAQYYAAYGAVLYGIEESEQLGRFLGFGALDAIAAGGGGDLRRQSGPPLVSGPDEAEAFRREFQVPTFSPPAL